MIGTKKLVGRLRDSACFVGLIQNLKHSKKQNDGFPLPPISVQFLSDPAQYHRNSQ